MTFIVTVHFKGEAKNAKAALENDPELKKNIQEGIFKYGLIRTERLIGNGEFIDIDYWEKEEDRDAFVEAMGPELRRWNELAQITGMESKIWRSPAPEEDF